MWFACGTGREGHERLVFVVAVPQLDLANLEAGYHGLVRENETIVEVTPRIRAVGPEVCSYRIVNKHHGDAPFEVRTRLTTCARGLLACTCRLARRCRKETSPKTQPVFVGNIPYVYTHLSYRRSSLLSVSKVLIASIFSLQWTLKTETDTSDMHK